MKKGSIKGVQKINEDKSYIPDETLVTFIQDWLHIHKKKEELTKQGINLSLEDKNKIRESDRMKVYVLDNIIFPALANLTYFFEAMAASPKMSESFENELEEILDPRKAKSAAQFGSELRISSIQFRRNNLARLFDAMVSINITNYPDRQFVDDFRIGLMYQILNLIGDEMDRLLMHEYSHSQIWSSFWDDYKRLQGWMALLSRSIKESPKEFDRKLGFEPIWFSNKAPIGGWNFY